MPNRSISLVLIKANVCRILEPLLSKDGFSVLNGGRAIYFPSHGPQTEFKSQFGTVLSGSPKRISIVARSYFLDPKEYLWQFNKHLPIFMHDKERTETAENIDEQALLALVATKQEQILGRRGALF